MEGKEMRTMNYQPTKFCMHCGAQIPVQAVVCPACGGQVEELRGEKVQTQQPNIVINNSNTSANVNTNVNQNRNGGYGRYPGRRRNKWAAFFLCLFLGIFGAHKFYEGKKGMGILYLCTVGLLGIGWLVDLVSLFFKPNPYYV